MFETIITKTRTTTIKQTSSEDDSNLTNLLIILTYWSSSFSGNENFPLYNEFILLHNTVYFILHTEFEHQKFKHPKKKNPKRRRIITL